MIMCGVVVLSTGEMARNASEITRHDANSATPMPKFAPRSLEFPEGDIEMTGLRRA